MQRVLKPRVGTAIQFGSVGLIVACAALNRWSFGDGVATSQATLFLGAATLFLGVLAMSVVMSDRVSRAVLQPSVDPAAVRRRFLLAAGIAFVLGTIVLWRFV
jgi:hypothetical protein